MPFGVLDLSRASLRGALYNLPSLGKERSAKRETLSCGDRAVSRPGVVCGGDC